MGAVGLEIALVVALIVFNGLLAGSELAIVSARKTRLQQRASAGDSGARAALALANQPNRFLSTVQIGITLVGILAGAFGGATLADHLANWFRDQGVSEGWATPLAVGAVVIAITYLSLIVGELVPKRIALAQPERVAGVVARPMHALSVVAAPAVKLLSISTDAVLGLFRLGRVGEAAVTEEELRMLLQMGAESGVIEAAEQEMAFAVLRFGDRTVADIMTPRTDVTWIDASDPLDEILDTIAGAPHDRFPVCQRSPDYVLGVLAVKELFAAQREHDIADIRLVMRPALFIPESASVLTALERFREGGPFGIAIDEYGGMAGVVTLTDLLECIVGDMPQPGEDDAEAVAAGPDGSWLIDGRVSIERLGEMLQLGALPQPRGYQTVAGFVLEELGHVPSVGDAFTYGDFRFVVVDMDARRIDRIMVTPTGSGEGTADGDAPTR